jgi:hypothetical protein
MSPLSCRFFPPGTRAKALLASDQSQIERTPFFWRHYVRFFTISFSKRRLEGCAGLRSYQRRGFPLMERGVMDIQVELHGEEIVITNPPSSFLLVYRKSSAGPSLVLTRSRMPPMSVATASEFRSNAYRAAVSKAWELGWIA